MKMYLILCSVALTIVFVFSSFAPVSITRDDYKPGYYIDSTGKVEGYIYFDYMSYEKFYFKKNLSDKKIAKHVNECSGFSVESKTFRVMENIEMWVGVWKVSAEKAFAEVAVEGRLSLYKVYCMLGSSDPRNHMPSQIINYFLEKDNSKKYFYIPISRGKFRDKMMDYFQDRIDIAEKVDDGTYSVKNIVDMVKDYNAKP